MHTHFVVCALVYLSNKKQNTNFNDYSTIKIQHTEAQTGRPARHHLLIWAPQRGPRPYEEGGSPRS